MRMIERLQAVVEQIALHHVHPVDVVEDDVIESVDPGFQRDIDHAFQLFGLRIDPQRDVVVEDVEEFLVPVQFVGGRGLARVEGRRGLALERPGVDRRRSDGGAAEHGRVESQEADHRT